MRVSRLSVAPGSKIQLRQTRDAVLVHLEDGGSEFLKSQSLGVFDNPEDKATADVIVELRNIGMRRSAPAQLP